MEPGRALTGVHVHEKSEEVQAFGLEVESFDALAGFGSLAQDRGEG
jgi:hypothetical protein